MQSWSKEEQKRRDSEPMYWFNKSSDLRASAGAIWYCIERKSDSTVTEELGLGNGFDMSLATWPVYLMLCGLSLELIYKSVIVAVNGKPTTGHKLNTLAKSAGIPLTKDEEGLLGILMQSIYWHGKYPSPLPKDHKSIYNLSSLSTKYLTEHVPGISIDLRRTKSPHPLGWDGFNTFWRCGAEKFWKHHAI